MPTTIADLWLLALDDSIPNIRGPLYSSRQIGKQVRYANAERRHGRTDWTAVELEKIIREYIVRGDSLAAGHGHHSCQEPGCMSDFSQQFANGEGRPHSDKDAAARVTLDVDPVPK